jgi:hypothetical protein
MWDVDPVVDDDPLVFVEEHSLRHYEENGGWRGLHCEGGPIVTLFGLLMWDVLFMPVPDVFLTPFQDGCVCCVPPLPPPRPSPPFPGTLHDPPPSLNGSISVLVCVGPCMCAWGLGRPTSRPLDLDFPQCFYSARREAIRGRLAAIATTTPSALVSDLGQCWRLHNGQACRGVSWSYPLQFLQLLAVGSNTPLETRRHAPYVDLHSSCAAFFVGSCLNSYTPRLPSSPCGRCA